MKITQTIALQHQITILERWAVSELEPEQFAALFQHTSAMRLSMGPDRELRVRVTTSELLPKIADAIAVRFKLTRETLTKNKSRAREDLGPRQLAQYLMRRITCSNLHEIGELFHADHGTILHSINAISNRIATEPNFKAMVSQIESDLRARFDGHIELRPSAFSPQPSPLKL